MQLGTAALFASIIISNIPATLSGIDSSRSEYPNVAYLRPTDQGPDEIDAYGSHWAVDGIFESEIKYCTHTLGEPIHWWLVELKTAYVVHGVAILNRNTNADRLANFTIDVFRDDPRQSLVDFPEGYGQVCTHQVDQLATSSWGVFNCTEPLIGQYLRIVKYGDKAITVCEVEVFAVEYPIKTRSFKKNTTASHPTQGSEVLGKFRSAIECASALIKKPEYGAFDFDPETGSCSGSDSGLSVW